VIPHLNLFLKNKKTQKVVGWQGGKKLYIWVALNHYYIYIYIYIYKRSHQSIINAVCKGERLLIYIILRYKTKLEYYST